ncbi:FAD/FMN-containing isoamyl alcohol oxidase MreA-like protein [Peziza echinospora]|nr:FAD/FMN-containing isoamyl alcohol oxidase MreA-like protein [Peziza echinospora]
MSAQTQISTTISLLLLTLLLLLSNSNSPASSSSPNLASALSIPPFTNTTQCKCLPSQPCWPAPSDWAALNHSTNGALLDVRPIAAACYVDSEEYDAERCAEVETFFGNSSWRGGEVGAVQHTTWEPHPPTHEACYLPSHVLSPNPPPKTCQQGSLPLYAIRAQSVQDIQATLRFVNTHNIPLSIKNSGHDFLGRATRRDSLMLWTHFLDGIVVIDPMKEGGGGDGGNSTTSRGQGIWYPEGCDASNGKEFGEEEVLIQVEAGVELHALYAKAAELDRSVVGGSSPTVGAAGGYIQGGGHSLLGPWKGMGSDNVVELEAVSAEGKLLTASPCTNPELFWALRGGGGGTFAVVTKATLRTHPNPPVVVYNFNVTVPLMTTNSTTTPTTKFWTLIEKWHSITPGLNDLNGGGYYFILTDVPPGIHMFIAIVHFPVDENQPSEEAIAEYFLPFETWVYQEFGTLQSGLVARDLTTLPKVSFLFTAMGTFENGLGGTNILGSRLLARDAFLGEDGLRKMTSAFRDISEIGGPFNVILGHIVAGGAVSANGAHISSALNPAWRKALVHLVVTHGWQPGDPFERQQEVKDIMTHKMVPKLKELDYDAASGMQTMGSYMNEADKEEEEWQESFWGENYAELRRLKIVWDPKGVFWCRPCVGSEGWDREGVCRVPELFKRYRN